MTTPQELADRLIGTCEMCVVDEELTTHDDIVSFDSLAFLCDGCNWWCSTDELNNETSRDLCDDCIEETEE